MPSFGNRLAAEFESEFIRLANDWYLRWHDLARGEAIDVDDFRGGRIRLQNTHFDAVAEHAYWAAVGRHADAKIDETFHRADNEILAQGGFQTEAIAEETTIALRSFLEKLHRHAVFTEYRLQERGYPDERYLDSRRDGAVAAEIQQRKIELLEKYRLIPWWRRIALTVTSRRSKWLIILVFLTSTITGGVAVVFRYAN